ncbi:hypothetical protein [Rhodopseudomonas palustris]|uniref:Uncharacterized protein n=1 Tax=Rhodopseudomonas palustris TaxID=1076 RepID=A0A418V488_RHOPL|nr:hypothetical protein [Rhodopseudomonas palustris]RJF70867.1 hypothetical protein D4Q52_14655 [Rhodopseudomonas palustris]
MFKVAADRIFSRDVTVLTPADGGHVKETLKVSFNYLDIDAVARFDLKTADGTTAFLKAIVRRLDDLTDVDDRPLPYSTELRDAVLRLGHVRQAIATAYFAAVNGDAQAGN